jgi:isocitrate dehydrogenase
MNSNRTTDVEPTFEVAENQPVPVTVAPGDGIGPKIVAATLEVLKAAGALIEPRTVEIGEAVYRGTQRSEFVLPTPRFAKKLRIVLTGLAVDWGRHFKTNSVFVCKWLVFKDFLPWRAAKTLATVLVRQLRISLKSRAQALFAAARKCSAGSIFGEHICV